MWAGAIARLLRATRLIDVAAGKFQAARQEIVLALASDAVLAHYNDLAYTATEAYHPRAAQYRGELFDWESSVLSRFFPPAPASVLVGAAGGGREAFALARQGYAVVAFEPSPLVHQMAAACAEMTGAGRDGGGNGPRGMVDPCRGRYGDLPVLRRLDGTPVDLRDRPPFEAGVMGWGSFSHLTSDSQRIAALRAFAAVVHGPVLLSFFGRILPPGPPPTATGLRRVLGARTRRRPGCMFSIDVGVYRQLTGDDLHLLAKAAGVEVRFLDTTADWPHAVVQRPTASRAT